MVRPIRPFQRFRRDQGRTPMLQSPVRVYRPPLPSGHLLDRHLSGHQQEAFVALLRRKVRAKALEVRLLGGNSERNYLHPGSYLQHCQVPQFLAIRPYGCLEIDNVLHDGLHRLASGDNSEAHS